MIFNDFIELISIFFNSMSTYIYFIFCLGFVATIPCFIRSLIRR